MISNMITFCCEAEHSICMLFLFFFFLVWCPILENSNYCYVGRSSVVTESISSRLITLLWIHCWMLYYFYVMCCKVIKWKKKKKKLNLILRFTEIVMLYVRCNIYIELNKVSNADCDVIAIFPGARLTCISHLTHAIYTDETICLRISPLLVGVIMLTLNILLLLLRCEQGNIYGFISSMSMRLSVCTQAYR